MPQKRTLKVKDRAKQVRVKKENEGCLKRRKNKARCLLPSFTQPHGKHVFLPYFSLSPVHTHTRCGRAYA